LSIRVKQSWEASANTSAIPKQVETLVKYSRAMRYSVSLMSHIQNPTCLKKPLASFGERVCKACAIASETRFEGARLSLAQELLNFRPGHLEGIEVRRIGGQIKHACTRACNPFTHPRDLMRFGVI
jgi:hypothetical protein